MESNNKESREQKKEHYKGHLLKCFEEEQLIKGIMKQKTFG